MKASMKKSLLTAALSCAVFGNVFADVIPVTDSRFGQYNIFVKDFIILDPHGPWPAQDEPQVDFLDASGNPIANQPETFTVTANRSWKVRIYSSTFDRNPPSDNLALIGDHIDPSLIYQVESTPNGAADVMTHGADLWQNIPLQSPTGGVVVAESATGGFQEAFTLRGRIIPRLYLNMSGDYTANVTIVAALD